MHVGGGRHIEEDLDAEGIRHDEGDAGVEGAVVVGFGGEVDDGGGACWSAGVEGGLDFIRVGDIAFYEFIAWGFLDGGEAFGGGGVGEGVGIDEGDVRSQRACACSGGIPSR